MKYGTAIFDMHGTLVYEDPDVHEQGRIMAQRLGQDPEIFKAAFVEDIRPVMAGQMQARQRYQKVLENLGLDASPHAVTAFEDLETELRLGAARLYPGIPEILERLRESGLRLGLLTNCTPLWRQILDHTGLAHQFNAVFLSCDKAMAKPDKRFFASIMEELSAVPEKTLYIGDGGDMELETAIQLGMAAVYIDHQPKTLWKKGPTDFAFRITSYTELPEIIEMKGQDKGPEI